MSNPTEEISIETKFSNLLEEFNIAKSKIEEMEKVKEAYDKQTAEYNQLKEDFIKLSKNIPIVMDETKEEKNDYKTIDELKSMSYNDAYDYLKEKATIEIKG